MKTSSPLLVGLLLLSICKRNDLYMSGYATIPGQVLRPRQIIHLGDSVGFSFLVPDTLMVDGVKTSVNITGKDLAAIDFSACKIDVHNTAGFAPYTKSCSFYASPGSVINNGALTFANVNGHLLGRLYMIPQRKGVYFLEQVQAGYAKLNNQSLQVRLQLSLGKVDRNHQLLIDSSGLGTRFAAYLQDRTDRGLETYGFRVD